MRVRVYDVLPAHNGVIKSGTYTVSYNTIVECSVSADAASTGVNIAGALAEQGYGLTDQSRVMWTPLDQDDCKIVNGVAQSGSFDRWQYENYPPDYGHALPDWPAWSAMFAKEPIGPF